MSQPSKTLVKLKELVAMQITFVVTEVFLSYPQFTAQKAAEASWMIPLLSGVFALVLFLFVNWLIQSRFPNMDIVDIANFSFGSFTGLVVALVLALYFLLFTAAVMRLFMEHVIFTVLPNTPIFIVGGLFTVVVGYVSYLGFEAICRTAYLLLPVLVIGVPVLCLLTINWWHPDFLLPLWGNGVSSVLRWSGVYSSIYINVLLLVLLYPHSRDPGKMGRTGVVSIISADVLITGFVLVYNMVFPTTEGQSIAFPFYQMARVIYIGRFFQRMESLFIFLWVMMAVIRMATMLWATGYLLSRAFKWPTFRPAVPALALLAFALSLLPRSAVQMVSWAENYLVAWGDVVVFGIPVLITVLAALVRALRKNGSFQCV